MRAAIGWWSRPRGLSTAPPEGDNRLEVQAASGDGSWESEPAVLLLRYEKPLPKPQLYVLAVGIDRYREPALAKLDFAAADAGAMAQLFRKRGSALYQEMHI